MTKVSAIVLAAGLSKRMGPENKLFLEIKGRPMVDWVIEQVKASTVDDMIVVASERSIDLLSKWKSDRIRVVENQYYKSGMTSSIQAGIMAASADGYMVCLGDQPKIKTSTYNQIVAGFRLTYPGNSKAIAVPFYGEKKGNPAVFSSMYRESILNHQEPEGCKRIISDNREAVLPIQIDDGGILTDIDTPDDYSKFY